MSKSDNWPIYKRKTDQGEDVYYFSRYEYDEKIERFDNFNFKIDEFNALLERENVDSFNYEFTDNSHVYFRMGTLKSPSVTEIPNGFYHLEYSDERGIELRSMGDEGRFDYIDLGGAFEELSEFISDFYLEEALALAKKRNKKHKDAALLWGPPGTGKTTEILKSIQKHKDKSIIIMCKGFNSDIFEKLKGMKGKSFIFIFEEITEDVRDNLQTILQCVDGVYALNNQLILATTNYPEKLPGNVVDRGGRFGKLIEFKLPTREQRKIYLEDFLERDITQEELEATDTLSLGYLNDACSYCIIKKVPFMDYVKQIKERKKLIKKAFAKTKALGLAGEDE